jgi:serpin B
MTIQTRSEPPPPVQFVVDRPFLFMLRDERTGASLFAGYVADPSSPETSSASSARRGGRG